MSLISMMSSYYYFGRYANALSAELQRITSIDAIPLSVRHLQHSLVPLTYVRESRILTKHLMATLTRLSNSANIQMDPDQSFEARQRRSAFAEESNAGKSRSPEMQMSNHQRRTLQQEVVEEDVQSIGRNFRTAEDNTSCDVRSMHTAESDRSEPYSLPELPFRRSSRFEFDTPNICIYIERSKNANLVVYEGIFTKDGTLDPKVPLHPYWLDIDPGTRAEARKKGKMDDRSELNYLEKKMAYGVSSKEQENTPGVFDVDFVAISNRALTLRTHTPSGLPIVVGPINGRDCIFEKIYVKSIERFPMPKVEYVDLFGYDASTMERVTERVVL
jgi:hypothetical protein